MKFISKNRKEKFNNIDFEKIYEPVEAIKILKDTSYVKFNETLDISINLKINSEKTDQNIRGVINLPKGSGKNIKVAVMAKGDKADEARKAGAEIVGDEDLAEQISTGNINFDILISTPDMMPTIGKIGKVLGPKGLMPNPKLGTVTQEISKAVMNAKSGQVQFRNDKAGIVHAGVGKLSFSEEDLLDNIKAFYESVNKSKPETIKGSFIKKVTIASTMGIGLKINSSSLRWF